MSERPLSADERKRVQHGSVGWTWHGAAVLAGQAGALPLVELDAGHRPDVHSRLRNVGAGKRRNEVLGSWLIGPDGGPPFVGLRFEVRRAAPFWFIIVFQTGAHRSRLEALAAAGAVALAASPLHRDRDGMVLSPIVPLAFDAAPTPSVARTDSERIGADDGVPLPGQVLPPAAVPLGRDVRPGGGCLPRPWVRNVADRLSRRLPARRVMR